MADVLVDNTSPRILYNGAWTAATHPGDFNQTTTFTDQVGAGFNLTFVGTSITVWGCILPDADGFALFTIDDQKMLLRGDGNSTEYLPQILQFTSPALSAGQHVLLVSVPPPAGGAGTTYCFDYIQYTPADAAPALASVGVTVPTAASSPGADTGSGRAATSLGVVLPAVLVPCLLVIAALVGALFYMRRRRARKAPSPAPSERTASYVAPTPYAPFAGASMAEKDVKVVDKDGNPVFSSGASTISTEAPPTYISQ
ncbi:hypothetical protein PsYK624_150720 [Phanerochaete sordida]|uniref:Uncharacterized protein n=1 Tax=Phanerochaete sordida TaxID=48140 RepID=A0A9P3GSR1_9APHY|nr:hypothetical protein PsYK624_150720 [Phanerochaete sordida]